MSRLLQFLFVFLLSVSPVLAAGTPILVFDPKTGAVLREESASEPWFPASLTKLMTAYVAFNAIASGRMSYDVPIRISARALAEPPSKLGMPVGAEIELGRAIEILIVKSANDLAVAIAEGVSGSVETFVAEMNAAAARLGMADTHFVNPNGLPDHRQVTTARDLALLTSAIIREFPQYDSIFAAQAVKVGKRNLRNHNTLLGRFKGADGMKTGFICASGYNLVASATRDGHRLVAVVLGATSSKMREDVAGALLEEGFGSGWWNKVASQSLAQIAPTAQDGRPATHLGPQVCKKRYPADQDAYAVDLRLQMQEQERKRIAAAKADEDENGSSDSPPLALAEGTKLPDVVDRLDKVTPVRGRLAPGTPLPTLRPQR